MTFCNSQVNKTTLKKHISNWPPAYSDTLGKLLEYVKPMMEERYTIFLRKLEEPLGQRGHDLTPTQRNNFRDNFAGLAKEWNSNAADKSAKPIHS